MTDGSIFAGTSFLYYQLNCQYYFSSTKRPYGPNVVHISIEINQFAFLHFLEVRVLHSGLEKYNLQFHHGREIL